MIGQVLGPHHKFHSFPQFIDMPQFPDTILPQEKMGIDEARTVEIGFKRHIPQEDLVARIDLIVLLEKCQIVRVEEPDAESIP